MEGNFTQWFDVKGQLDRKALRRWLAGHVEVVALGDPEAKKEWDDEIEEQRVDEEVVSEGAIRSGATIDNTTESAKKRGRPRKVWDSMENSWKKSIYEFWEAFLLCLDAVDTADRLSRVLIP